MNYFVSAENTAYYHWQLELLIESFKLHNLQDSLIIAIAENNQPIYANFTSNLNTHKHIFTHKNVGYNRIYGLCTALENKLIQQPLVVLHPDTILIKEFEIQNAEVSFQLDTFPQPPEVKDFVEAVKVAKNAEGEFWIPLGDTILLKNVEMAFLHRVLEIASFLKKEKLAWILTLLEYSGHLQYNGTFDYENTMLDNELKYLIHYKHGLPPVFSKKMFTYEPFSMGHPYEILLQHNPTVVTNYMQKIVNLRHTKTNNNKLNANIPLVNVVKEHT